MPPWVENVFAGRRVGRARRCGGAWPRSCRVRWPTRSAWAGQRTLRRVVRARDTLWSIATEFTPDTHPRVVVHALASTLYCTPARRSRDNACPSRPPTSDRTDGFDHPTSWGQPSRRPPQRGADTRHEMPLVRCGRRPGGRLTPRGRAICDPAVGESAPRAAVATRPTERIEDVGLLVRQGDDSRDPVSAREGHRGHPESHEEPAGVGVRGPPARRPRRRSGCAGRAQRSPPSRSGGRYCSQLRKLDEVADIRVYKDFQEITDFERELGTLLRREPAKRRKR